MTFVAMIPLLIQVLVAFFKFPAAVSALVKEFKDLPEESREKIMQKIREEQDKFKETGRPTWG